MTLHSIDMAVWPEPPFDTGSTEKAPDELVQLVRSRIEASAGG